MSVTSSSPFQQQLNAYTKKKYGIERENSTHKVTVIYQAYQNG